MEGGHRLINPFWDDASGDNVHTDLQTTDSNEGTFLQHSEAKNKNHEHMFPVCIVMCLAGFNLKPHNSVLPVATGWTII